MCRARKRLPNSPCAEISGPRGPLGLMNHVPEKQKAGRVVRDFGQVGYDVGCGEITPFCTTISLSSWSSYVQNWRRRRSAKMGRIALPLPLLRIHKATAHQQPYNRITPKTELKTQYKPQIIQMSMIPGARLTSSALCARRIVCSTMAILSGTMA